MLWLPTASVYVSSSAVPLDVSATVPSTVVPSVNVTDPAAGAVPEAGVTVATSCTVSFLEVLAGYAASAVVVAIVVGPVPPPNWIGADVLVLKFPSPGKLASTVSVALPVVEIPPVAVSVTWLNKIVAVPSL